MKQSLLLAAIVSASAYGVMTTSPVAAEVMPLQPQERAEPAPADLAPVPPRMGAMPGRDVLGLAAQLSAAEVYLGVTPEQLGAWRAYTTALLDVVSPGPDKERPLPPPPEAPALGDANPPVSPEFKGNAPEDGSRLPGEALAKGVLERAGKAKALQDAVASLRPKLTPEQVRKLAELHRIILVAGPPPGPMRGPRPEGPAPHDHEKPRG